MYMDRADMHVYMYIHAAHGMYLDRHVYMYIHVCTWYRQVCTILPNPVHVYRIQDVSLKTQCPVFSAKHQ